MPQPTPTPSSHPSETMSNSNDSTRPPDNRLRGLLWPLAFAALFAAVWIVGVRAFRLEASLAEGNYQANMIRLGSYLHGDPGDAVLVGTSISGRLLPEFFLEKGLRVANLGLDGAMPVTSLDIVLRREDLPPLVLVEARALDRPPHANDAQLLAAIDSASFRMAPHVPTFDPSYRPSAVLYSRLKRWADARRPGHEGRMPEHPGGPAPQNPPSPGQVAALDEIAARIAEIQRRGSTVMLVHIPSSHPVEHSHPDGISIHFAKRLGISLVNVAHAMAEAGESVRYSDGLHLATPSARLAAHRLAGEVSARPDAP